MRLIFKEALQMKAGEGFCLACDTGADSDHSDLTAQVWPRDPHGENEEDEEEQERLQWLRMYLCHCAEWSNRQARKFAW